MPPVMTSTEAPTARAPKANTASAPVARREILRGRTSPSGAGVIVVVLKLGGSPPVRAETGPCRWKSQDTLGTSSRAEVNAGGTRTP